MIKAVRPSPTVTGPDPLRSLLFPSETAQIIKSKINVDTNSTMNPWSGVTFSAKAVYPSVCSGFPGGVNHFQIQREYKYVIFSNFHNLYSNVIYI